MEDWQRTAIRENRIRLIENIKVNCHLLACLESAGVLSVADRDALAASTTSAQQASDLLDILVTRIAYEKLIDALTHTSQTGAAKVLTEAQQIYGEQVKDLPTISIESAPINHLENFLSHKTKRSNLENWKKLADHHKLQTLIAEVKLPKPSSREQTFYSNLESVHEFQQYVSKNIKKLVSGAYTGTSAELNTVENLLLIIYHSCIGEERLEGFRILYDKIQEKKGIWSFEALTLLFYLSIVISKAGRGAPAESLHVKYVEFIAEFPEVMQAIGFGETVTIKHRYYQEFLVEEKLVETGLRRTVLCWKPRNVTKLAFFYFEPVMTNGKLFYTLCNDAIDEGSAVVQSSFSWKHLTFFPCSKRWKVVTAPDIAPISELMPIGSEMKWLLEPCRENCFKIKTWNDKYLYAPIIQFSHDYKRRYVFLWKGLEKLSDRETVWEIQTKEVSTMTVGTKERPQYFSVFLYEFQKHWWHIPLAAVIFVYFLGGDTLLKALVYLRIAWFGLIDAVQV